MTIILTYFSLRPGTILLIPLDFPRAQFFQHWNCGKGYSEQMTTYRSFYHGFTNYVNFWDINICLLIFAQDCISWHLKPWYILKDVVRGDKPIRNSATGTLTPFKRPDTVLNWSTLCSVTAGKCVALQTKNSQKRENFFLSGKHSSLQINCGVLL